MRHQSLSVSQSLFWDFVVMSIRLIKYALLGRWHSDHLLFVCLGCEKRNPLLGSFLLLLVAILDNDYVVCCGHLLHDSDHLSLSDDTACFRAVRVRNGLSAHGLMLFDNLRLD